MKPSWVLSNVERDKRFNKRRKAYGGGDANDEAIASGVRITDQGPVNVRRDVAPPPASQRQDSSPSTSAMSLNADPVIELSVEDWHAIEKYNSFTKCAFDSNIII